MASKSDPCLFCCDFSCIACCSATERRSFMIYDGGHETDEVYNTEIKWMNMKLNMIHMSEDSNVNSQAAAGFACCLVLVLVFSRHTHTQTSPTNRRRRYQTRTGTRGTNNHTSLSCLTLSYSSTSSALSSIRVGGRRSAMVLDLELGLLNACCYCGRI